MAVSRSIEHPGQWRNALPRHTFSFPSSFREEIRSRIAAAVRRTDVTRARQEHAYTSVLLGKLDDIKLETDHGSFFVRATVYDDRGPGAAEAQFGADFAITATISDPRNRVEKAILFQAKIEDLSKISSAEDKRLRAQLRKMKGITRSPKILEMRSAQSGERMPHVVSGIRYLTGAGYTSIPLPDYVVRRVLTTLDGDTRPSFVKDVEDSTLAAFRLEASLVDVSSRP